MLPLLLVPGLMNDARVWRCAIEAFSRERIVVAADSSRHDTIAAIATDALATAPGPRFALAGFSLGGYVALEIVRRAPERVAGLALVDTGSRPDTPEATAMRERMIAAVGAASTSYDPVIASFLPRVVHPSRVGDRALIDVFVDMAKAVGIDGFVRQQRAAMSRIDSRPTLPTIRVPALVFCGRDDQVTPLELSEETAATIPGAELVVADACGHMSPMERPDELVAAMRAWLARVPNT